jgi:hypothetical protein
MKLKHTLTHQPGNPAGEWLYEARTDYFGKSHAWFARLDKDPRPYPRTMEHLEVSAKRAIRAHIVRQGARA